MPGESGGFLLGAVCRLSSRGPRGRFRPWPILPARFDCAIQCLAAVRGDRIIGAVLSSGTKPLLDVAFVATPWRCGGRIVPAERPASETTSPSTAGGKQPKLFNRGGRGV